MKDNPIVICFGEILWDIFPDKKNIGGAPLNVALRLHTFGVSTQIISCLGDDENGQEARAYIEDCGLISKTILKHSSLPTGEVLVTLDATGSASYDIKKPAAWDAIGLYDEMIDLVKEAPYFVYGSLAVRGTYNINTLHGLLQNANTKIFDVNLRAPYYNVDMIYELMQQANVIKLNDEELAILCSALGCEATAIEEQIVWLGSVTQTSSICVTLGAAGAVLWTDQVFYQHQGIAVSVVDTVGAGDSFLATLIDQLLVKAESPKNALARACTVGALVASKSGANCSVSELEINNKLNSFS